MFNFKNNGISIVHINDFNETAMAESEHFHTFFEVIFFCKGDVVTTVESNSKKLEPGDVVLIQPGKYHYININRKFVLDRYMLCIPEELIPKYLAEKLYKCRNFYSRMSEISEHFEDLEAYYNNDVLDDDDKLVLLTAKCIEILIHLTHKSIDSVGDNDAVIKKVIDYIEKNINKDISLSMIANEMCYSKSYISNVFKNKMKCSLMQYIKSKKCCYAYKLIQYGEKPLEVAYKLGYEEYSTFFRAFKSQFGISPSDVRKNLEEFKS